MDKTQNGGTGDGTASNYSRTHDGQNEGVHYHSTRDKTRNGIKRGMVVYQGDKCRTNGSYYCS